MGTRPRPRYVESPNQLGEALSAALEPVTTELKELRKDISRLELTTIPRADVYDRSVMDEKMNQLRTETEAVRAEIKGLKDFMWKMIGGVGTLALILATASPHIHFQ